MRGKSTQEQTVANRERILKEQERLEGEVNCGAGLLKAFKDTHTHTHTPTQACLCIYTMETHFRNNLKIWKHKYLLYLQDKVRPLAHC